VEVEWEVEIEPLIDFWLEHYTWRSQESYLNTLPPFRTAIQVGRMRLRVGIDMSLALRGFLAVWDDELEFQRRRSQS